MEKISALLGEAIDDCHNGWSIGVFGGIAEFMREPEEVITRGGDGETFEIHTARGGLRVRPSAGLRAIAYDTLSSDGESWNQSVAFCLPVQQLKQGVVRFLGRDNDSIRTEDRDAMLFDLGVGQGAVRLCARTKDAQLIAALEGIERQSLFGPQAGAVMGHVLRAQPHRIGLSPIGRVEVYTQIPGAGGHSPHGPHTHILPKLLASGMMHAANAPIPEGMQAVLMLHPQSPWRDGMGERKPFDAALAARFEALLHEYGLADDRSIAAAVRYAVTSGKEPGDFAWPKTRRGRVQARITLRRLAKDFGGAKVAAWRALYDQAHEEREDDPAEAAH